MATIWRVKNGDRGDTTDKGAPMSIEELTSKLELYSCQYLTEQPPTFNSLEPSEYYRHIAIEVTNDDSLNNKFSKIGFYVVADFDSSQAGLLFI